MAEQPDITPSTPESRQRRRAQRGGRWFTLAAAALAVLTLIPLVVVSGGVEGWMALVVMLAPLAVGVLPPVALRALGYALSPAPRTGRCPDCGYDLTGVPETPDAACPDCGARDPHQDSTPTSRR